ncbi:PREDICTED: gametocyte-specific factor 1-like [Gekko japonicus]|uniref:Gametocyte-specific factor 1-like n=1 Tax=Gekko japonicus TaxID=146911 RepID=A0ABM1KTC3_GEKJA|nr:PREDICTED: gametocyte-specific factor 1-like [Gekko japonicus]
MDPERLLQCPYDKNHQIRACRFPYHLVKCRENNKKIAKELATCPYNARHRVPRQELNLHIASCESKMAQELEEGNSHNKTKEITAFQCPPSQENWEADAEEFPARPFVFGKSYLHDGNPNMDSSSSKVLPWKSETMRQHKVLYHQQKGAAGFESSPSTADQHGYPLKQPPVHEEDESSDFRGSGTNSSGGEAERATQTASMNGKAWARPLL